MRKFASIVAGVLLASVPVHVQADVYVGNIKIMDDGNIVFSDNSMQSTATMQGPQGPVGPQGPKGDPGTPGSAVTKDSMCQVYADDNLPAPPYCGKKIIFITSQNYDGNLGGLAGADQICQTAAANAGLPGTYVAWLSDSTTAAKDRVTHSPAPYVRTDGTIIANNWLDLTDGWLKDQIMCDESKTCYSVTDAGYYHATWTYTTIKGNIGVDQWDTQLSNLNCSEWTSNSASAYGIIGNFNTINPDWSESDYDACNWQFSLYCVQQ